MRDKRINIGYKSNCNNGWSKTRSYVTIQKLKGKTNNIPEDLLRSVSEDNELMMSEENIDTMVGHFCIENVINSDKKIMDIDMETITYLKEMRDKLGYCADEYHLNVLNWIITWGEHLINKDSKRKVILKIV